MGRQTRRQAIPSGCPSSSSAQRGSGSARERRAAGSKARRAKEKGQLPPVVSVKKKKQLSLGCCLGCRSCPACRKRSPRLGPDVPRQADAGGVLGGSSPPCRGASASGSPGLSFWSFFTSPAKREFKLQLFFLGLPPAICARTLPARCTNISPSPTSAARAPLAGPAPSPAAPAHPFRSPTRLLSCK